MTHFLTDDQKLVQNSVREFCQSPETQEITAAAKQAGGFPTASWEQAAAQGYIAAFVPEEYGGMGYDLTTYFVMLEELTRCGHPAANSMGAHDLGILPLLYWGTDEQKKEFLTPLGSGKSIACGAVTDPAGLTNFPQWGLTAAPDGDGIVLNGGKVMVSNAHVSDTKVIFGKPDGGHFDKVYIVPKDTAGVETGYQEKKLIPGLSDWGSINLKDVRIPAANVVKDNGFGQYWLGPSFMSIAITALVLGEGGFRMAMAYAKQRTKYDRPLHDLQAVSHKLMDMAVQLEAGRDLIYTGARLWDEGRYEEAYRLGCMSKIFVPAAANKVLHEAAILHGGVGFTPQAGIGVMWAASLQLEIAELPADVHKDFLAETYGISAGWKHGQA
ncbi:MAG: acyl-CoA dehydrogenase family protein [Propionibacteriaceae bacterium]|nr:acyl-CoA dehydrogenase family protein [Propionibacteriaceae bacterium]